MDERKIPQRLGWALFMMVLVTNGLEIGLGIYAGIKLPSFASSNWFGLGLTVIGFYLCGFPLFLLLTRRIPMMKLTQEHLNLREICDIYLVCMALGYAFSFLGTLVNAVISSFTGIETLNPVAEMAETAGVIPMAIVAGIIAPVIEETVFRGVVLRGMLPYGEKTAVWFSAIAFGLLHMNLYQFFYAVAIAVVFGHVYVKTGSLRDTVILHIMVNMTSTIVVPLITGISDSFLGIFVLGVILSGMSLWIKCRRGITEETVKRKEELLGLHESRIWLNTGSTAYCLLCIAGMVYSLM